MLKWAIVGCGRVVEEAHAPALEMLAERVQVVALADPSPERRESMGKRLGVPESARYAHSHELLARHAGSLDVVDLALPHYLHEEVTIACAEARVNIFSEKPLAPTLEGAHNILAAVERSGVRLFIAHNYVYRYPISLIHQVIAEGRIGTPFLIRTENLFGSFWSGTSSYDPAWRSRGKQSGGGALLDNGYHQVYAAETLMGAPVVAVSGHVGTHIRQQDVDDTALALLDHGGGRVTSLQVAWSVRGGGIPVMEVHGTAGSVRDGGKNGVEVYENSVGNWKTLPIPEQRDGWGFNGLLADVCAALENGAPPPADGAAALHNLAVIGAIYRASAEDRRVTIDEMMELNV